MQEASSPVMPSAIWHAFVEPTALAAKNGNAEYHTCITLQHGWTAVEVPTVMLAAEEECMQLQNETYGGGRGCATDGCVDELRGVIDERLAP